MSSLPSFHETLSPMCSPPLPSLIKKPQAQQQGDGRQLGCTHQKMTRLYDKYGATPCSVCHRDPDFGWLYRCTQDTDGSLPQSDFSDDPPAIPGTPPSSPEGIYLSPAALQAISSGQDDHDQDVDASQKINAEGDTRPTTRSSTTQESMTFSSIPQSTTFSTTATSADFDEEIQGAYDWPALDKVWQDNGSHEEQVEHPVSVCGFRICAACRPTYRDRAIQSIAGVLNNPIMAPQWEMENRRVSDARVLRSIGLPKSQRFNTETVPGATPAQSTVTSEHAEHRLEEDKRQENINDSHSHSYTSFGEAHHDQLCYGDNQTRPETLEPQF
ncbi:hypothetical protein DV738_g4391, partial [Chaetothyriales sp. CBS 135597]